MPDPMTQTFPSSDHSIEQKAAPQRGFGWYVMLALAAALIIRFFIAAPYVVSGASMEPTFDNWDYLITDRISYDFSEPARGQVIVFCLPNTGECSLFKRLMQGEWQAPRTLIKRVIGLPGETVSVNTEGVRIFDAAHPDGFLLDEPYIVAENQGGPTGMKVTLGPDEYFVLGDNRRVSSDSRTWGVLPKEDLIGHVLVRLFPLAHAGIDPGQAQYAGN